MRLDKFLTQNGFVDSRNRAQILIKSSKVSVDGSIITKVSFEIENQRVELLASLPYVSRAGEKLRGFLDLYPMPIKSKRCLDIGSSTGGFVQVLCEEDAAEVVAVDVGKAQLHDSLRHLSQVNSIEEMDIRDFRDDRGFDLVTCDVSFVGIEHILSAIDRLAKRDIVILFKPQFEVGREVKRDRRGVVKDAKAIISALHTFETRAASYGWVFKYKMASTVKGKEGNEEFFYHYSKQSD